MDGQESEAKIFLKFDKTIQNSCHVKHLTLCFLRSSSIFSTVSKALRRSVSIMASSRFSSSDSSVWIWVFSWIWASREAWHFTSKICWWGHPKYYTVYTLFKSARTTRQKLTEQFLLCWVFWSHPPAPVWRLGPGPAFAECGPGPPTPARLEKDFSFWTDLPQ